MDKLGEPDVTRTSKGRTAVFRGESSIGRLPKVEGQFLKLDQA